MERQFGRERPVRAAIVQLATLDHAHDGSVRVHDPFVVAPGRLTKSLSEQVDVGLADYVGRIRITEVLSHLSTDAQQTALTILEVDAVRRALHQGLEQEDIIRGFRNRHAPYPLELIRSPTRGFGGLGLRVKAGGGFNAGRSPASGLDPFQGKQPALDGQGGAAVRVRRAAVPAECAVSGDDSMAGDQDRERVAAHRSPDGLCRARPADTSRQFAIADRLAKLEPGGAREHETVPVGDAQVDRQVEAPALAGEPFAHLAAGLAERRAPFCGHFAVLPGQHPAVQPARQSIDEVGRFGAQVHGYDAGRGRGNVEQAPRSRAGREGCHRDGDERGHGYSLTAKRP